MKRDRGRGEKPVSDPLFFFLSYKTIAGNSREGKEQVSYKSHRPYRPY